LSGWAAKELTEKGFKSANARTRMNIEHIKDYDSAMKAPWEFERAGKLTTDKKNILYKLEIIHTMETFEKWWVNDLDCPYTEDKLTGIEVFT
jgi:hypothetical protein